MNKIVKSVSLAFVAQIFSLLVSVFMSFFVSKFISVEAYGFYQLFLFYSTYVGLTQFGVSEGVYLESGGKQFSELDLPDLKNLFWSTQIVQAGILILLMCGYRVFIPDVDRNIIIAMNAFGALIGLWGGYFGLMLQAVNETEKFSKAVIIGRIIALVLVVLAVILGVKDFITYCLANLFGTLIADIIITVYCRRVLTVKTPFHFNLKAHRKTVVAGMSLLLASLVSSFTIGINRIYIDSEYGIETFGRVSMALSLCNLFILFSIQVGMVMFPNVVNLSSKRKKDIYDILSTFITCMVPVFMVCYIPLQWILERWIPEYAESIRWMLFLVPYMVCEVKGPIIYGTYMKAFRKEKYLFKVNIIGFIVCAVVNLIVIKTTNSLELVFGVIMAILLVKAFIFDRVITKELNGEGIHIFLIEDAVCVATTLAFYLKTTLPVLAAIVAVYAVLLYYEYRSGKLASLKDLKALRQRNQEEQKPEESV